MTSERPNPSFCVEFYVKISLYASIGEIPLSCEDIQVTLKSLRPQIFLKIRGPQLGVSGCFPHISSDAECLVKLGPVEADDDGAFDIKGRCCFISVCPAAHTFGSSSVGGDIYLHERDAMFF
jgi:hypothetical protein